MASGAASEIIPREPTGFLCFADHSRGPLSPESPQLLLRLMRTRVYPEGGTASLYTGKDWRIGWGFCLPSTHQRTSGLELRSTSFAAGYNRGPTVRRCPVMHHRYEFLKPFLSFLPLVPSLISCSAFSQGHTEAEARWAFLLESPHLGIFILF